MRKLLFFVLMLCGFGQLLNAQQRCARFESILVDACGAPEGGNEMFRFMVGPNDLNTSNLSVTWSSNPWLGVCQDALTAQVVQALNRTITHCGLLVEPVGGLLPAGKDVLFITSEHMDTLSASFSNLQDTLIVVFQCGNATTGHFKNYQAGSGPRTTILTFSGANGGSDTATYNVDSLVNLAGNHAASDGASVGFTDGVATSYYCLPGCQADVPVTTATITTNDTTTCAGLPVQLNARALNFARVHWEGGTGTFDFPDSLNPVYTPGANEIYPVSLIFKSYTRCTGDSVADTLVISKFAITADAGSDFSICQGTSSPLNPTGGNSYTWDASPYLDCTNCTSPNANPTSNTTFYVTIIDANSCSSRDSVTVSVNLNDSLSTTTPNDSICENGSAALNVYSSNGYSWTVDPSLTCTNCATPTATPATTTTYTVASTGICPKQLQITVTVIQPGVISITNNNATITCATTSIALTASSTNGSVSYDWGGGITGAINTVSAAGTYSVTSTDALLGCTATASATVGVNTTAPDASVAAPGSLSCTVLSVTLTASSTTTGATYNWGAGVTSATNTVTTGGIYTVTVTDPANGCTATAAATVTSAAGAISLTPATTNATCGNANGSVSVTASAGSAPYHYSWTTNDTTATVSNLGAGTYTVTVTDGAGCSAISSITVTASNNLSLISPTVVNTTCGLSNGSITSGGASGVGPYHFHWNTPDTTATIQNLAGGNYQVTVTDALGCSASASFAVSTSTGTSVSIQSDKQIICPGDTAHICATTTHGGYQWNGGATTSCINVTAAGNYYLTVTDNPNCTAESNHVSISTYPSPSIQITVNGDTLTALNGITYQWYLNGTIIPNATSPVYIAPVSGNYSVALTDNHGCRAVSNATHVSVGITVIGDDNDVKVYPNPLEGIEWQMEVAEQLIGSLCEVFDIEGKVIYKAEISSPVMHIDAATAKGMYILRIATDKGNYVKKLIKM